jgi:hypothetical protein
VVADVRGSTLLIGRDRQDLTGSDTNHGTACGFAALEVERAQYERTRHSLHKLA